MSDRGYRPVLRVYGSFAWPPLPGAKPGADLAVGTVELGYVVVGGRDEPVLSWLPMGASADVLSPMGNVAELTVEQLRPLLHDPAQAAMFALSKTASAAKKAPGLKFDGAAVLEQFRTPPEASMPIPQMRWLLARTFVNDGVTRTSSVLVGPAGNETGAPKIKENAKSRGGSITLAFALPTPWPQNAMGEYGLPLRVRFEPVAAVDATADGRWNGRPLPVARVVAGVAGGLSDSDAAGPGKRYPEAVASVEPRDDGPYDQVDVARWRLGTFGLCRSDGGRRALRFPRSTKSSPAGRDNFWPEDVERFANAVLKPFFGTSGKLGRAFRLSAPDGLQGEGELTAGGEARNSLWFPDVHEAGATSMRFRACLTGNPKVFTASQTADLVLGNQLEVALPGCDGARAAAAGRDLLIEAVVSYELGHEQAIWSAVAAMTPGSGESLGPELRADLMFGVDGKVDNSTPLTEVYGKEAGKDDTQVGDLLGQAIAGMRLARHGLHHSEGDQAQSALPEIKIDKAQTLLLAFCTRLEGRLAIKAGAASLSFPRLARKAAEPGALGRDPDFRMTLWPEAGAVPPRGSGRIDALLSLPSLASGPAPDAPVALVHEPRAFVPVRLEEAACVIGIRPRGIAPPPEMTVRLGGLELPLARGFLAPDGAQSTFGFTPRAVEIDDLGTRCIQPDVSVDLELAATGVLPVAADQGRGEATAGSAPLLIPMGESGSRDLFRLQLSESFARGRDRRLQARIFDRTAASESRQSYVVLSFTPFSVARVRPQPLGSRGDQERSEVANYSAVTRRWQFKLVDALLHVTLPSQSVGESMDKPRRLELHDWTGAASDPAVPRPFVEDGADGLPRRRAVEFRLTPPAELWVRPSDVERGYGAPEWALGSLWSGRGELGLGVGMAGFRGEFLYGLPVGIDTSREIGPARTARVAEIGALLGRPPGPLTTGDEPLRAAWRRLATAIARRPERLEVWMRDPDALVPLASARFGAGVTFALRDTALHAPTLPNLPSDAPSSGPRLSLHGLPGGALWPIESLNFAKQMLLTPQSTGGTIEHLALSPTGGDADQRAEFLDGRLAIISETRNGFVQRHRVEVLGRISVFWHRAKHVVVYERTVNASAQFPAGDADGTRSRRPVLRKVAEFVELLQPERGYPDQSSADPLTVGFLRSVRFNSRLINVDSAWSEDLGSWGWRVPLWNRHFAEQSPQVYGRPDIAFVTVSEGEGEAATVAQECLDPDLLHFVAEVSPVSVDTDAWLARPGVDFAPIPRPGHDQQRVGGGSSRQGASRVPRGHGRFTWRLAPAGRRTTVNAERGDKPVFAGLETLTFGRSDPTAPAGWDAAEWATMARAEGLEHGPFHDLAALGRAARGSDQEVIAAAKRLKADLEEARSWSGGLVGNLSGPSYTKLVDTIKGSNGSLAPCAKLKADFVRSLRSRKLVVLDTLRGWLVACETSLPPFPQPPSRDAVVDLLRKAAAAEIRRVVAPAADNANADLGGALKAIAGARDAVRVLGADVRGRIDRASRELGAIDAARAADNLPWSSQRLAELAGKIDAVRKGYAADLLRATANFTARLTAELGSVQNMAGRKIRTLVAKARNDMLSRVSMGAGVARVWWSGLDDGLQTARARLQDLLASVAEAETAHPDDAALPKVRAAIVDLLGTIDAARTALQAAELRVAAAGDAAVDGIEAAATAIATVTAEAGVRVEALKTATAALGSEAAEVIARADAAASSAASSLLDEAKAAAVELDGVAERLIRRLRDDLLEALQSVDALVSGVLQGVADAGGLIDGKLANLREATSGDAITDLIMAQAIEPAIGALVDRLGIDGLAASGEDARKAVVAALRDGMEEFANRLDGLGEGSIATVEGAIDTVCADLDQGFDSARKRIEELVTEPPFPALGARLAELEAAIGDAEALRRIFADAGADLKMIGDAVGQASEEAQAYADRMLDAAGGVLEGGIGSAPSNILKLWAAAGSAPEMPYLEVARDRLGYYYDAVGKVVDTTPAQAWFGRLGDELKALGLDLPFKGIGDRLIPEDLRNFDVGRILRNVGGLDLSGLFRNVRLPATAGDAVRISHEIDAKQARAWVQIDIDLPLPGRSPLVSIGPFTLDVLDARITATVRLEASKDGDRVAQTGRARLAADFDAVVGGQSMVTLQKLAVSYDRDGGLDVDLDPQNIRINPSLRFVQDALKEAFPDEVGGLQIIKRDGVPVGMEHVFSMPPLSAMAGTSGITNLQIGNRFELVAYPDFRIANRFSLSSPELPFMFSIFVIGGTGYLFVEAEYRPFRDQLTVTVEAAAGGSAALGFAAGPVSGSVFASLSIALSYSKSPERSGGLTVSVVLLIAGNVDVAGVANVYMGLLLRMNYAEDGRITGRGSLVIRIRISRFFTFKVEQNVERQLRGSTGGQPQSAVSDDRRALDEAEQVGGRIVGARS